MIKSYAVKYLALNSPATGYSNDSFDQDRRRN